MTKLRFASILFLIGAGGCSGAASTGGAAPEGSPGPGATTGSASSTGTSTGASVGPSPGTISTGDPGGSGAAGSTAAPSGAATGSGTGGATVTPGTTVITTPSQATGQLTAGTWDDNLNFDFYSRYLATMDATQMPGLPLIDRANRLEISVVDGGGAPVAGARVAVSDASGQLGVLWSAPTRGDGRLFFFPGTVGADRGAKLTIAAASGQATASAPAIVGDAAVRLPLPAASAAPVATLDLALVVDTTGSMGDELSFLKTEMANIVTRVAKDYPNVSQRWAAIFYRDTVDEYVVRPFDFTSSLDTLTSELAAQSAAGGGDIPEAPDQALARLTKLSWRADSVARMVFWVADAPHHAKDASTMTQDILTAAGMGLRLYPISASGTDDLLEYTMREAAEVTGGRYLFLTNDSGIGGSHKEPTIPCYVVTTLDKAMRRMIDMELLGTDAQPAAGDIIRTAGDPHDGTCTVSGTETVRAL